MQTYINTYTIWPKFIEIGLTVLAMFQGLFDVFIFTLYENIAQITEVKD